MGPAANDESRGLKEAMETTKADKKNWEPMQLAHLGHVGDILQQGGGKLSVSGGDPGEPRKQKGNDSGL